MLRHPVTSRWAWICVAAWLCSTSVLAQDDRRFRGGFGGPGSSGAMLLATPEVQKELAISDEQKGLIEDMIADLREQGRSGFNREELQNLTDEERQKRFDEARKRAEEVGKKTEEVLAMILEPKQRERFHQLRLQREGVAALTRPDVADQLALNQEQREKIRSIQEELRSSDRGLFRNFGNMSQEERQQAFTKVRQQREKANADILALLTTPQKESWEKMQGRKFDFPQQGRGRPGDSPRRRPESKRDER